MWYRPFSKWRPTFANLCYMKFHWLSISLSQSNFVLYFASLFDVTVFDFILLGSPSNFYPRASKLARNVCWFLRLSWPFFEVSVLQDFIVAIGFLLRIVLVSIQSYFWFYFHVTQWQPRKYLISRSYKNDEFDWPFLVGDCIIAWHESIILFLLSKCDADKKGTVCKLLKCDFVLFPEFQNNRQLKSACWQQ